MEKPPPNESEEVLARLERRMQAHADVDARSMWQRLISHQAWRRAAPSRHLSQPMRVWLRTRLALQRTAQMLPVAYLLFASGQAVGSARASQTWTLHECHASHVHLDPGRSSPGGCEYRGRFGSVRHRDQPARADIDYFYDIGHERFSGHARIDCTGDAASLCFPTVIGPYRCWVDPNDNRVSTLQQGWQVEGIFLALALLLFAYAWLLATHWCIHKLGWV